MVLKWKKTNVVDEMRDTSDSVADVCIVTVRSHGSRKYKVFVSTPIIKVRSGKNVRFGENAYPCMQIRLSMVPLHCLGSLVAWGGAVA